MGRMEPPPIREVRATISRLEKQQERKLAIFIKCVGPIAPEQTQSEPMIRKPPKTTDSIRRRKQR